MVKGKFDGMVSLSTPEGKYSHVKYVDGSPGGKWVEGPAPEGKSKKAVAEKSATPADPVAEASPEAPAEGPSPNPTQKAGAPETNSVEIVPEKTTSGSDSLRSLIAPPSSLPKTNSKLSRAEAIRSADEQAIAAGYSVGDYRDRKVSYDPQNTRWTITYAQAGTSGSASLNRPKQFTVTVDDGTGQASVAPAN